MATQGSAGGPAAGGAGDGEGGTRIPTQEEIRDALIELDARLKAIDGRLAWHVLEAHRDIERHAAAEQRKRIELEAGDATEQRKTVATRQGPN